MKNARENDNPAAGMVAMANTEKDIASLPKGISGGLRVRTGLRAGARIVGGSGAAFQTRAR